MLRFRHIFLSGAVVLVLQSPLHGQLLVTEIQSNQSPSAPGGAGDYWELTNFGSTTVPLGNYKWGDDGRLSTAVTVPAGTSIAPGESIIFTKANASNFRSWWGLSANVQVIGNTGAPGLGPSDAISFFDASGAEVFYFSYTGGGFTKSNGAVAGGGHAGPSAGAPDVWQALIWDPTFGTANPRYTFAAGGNFNTFKAVTGTDLGSPGVVGTAGVPPVVDFTADRDSVIFGGAVTFTATVQNATGDVSYLWDFGDGHADGGSGAVATHRYGRSGTFAVTVTAFAGNGNDSEVKTSLITVGAFGADSDTDGLADGLEYYFATNPDSGGRENLPRLTKADGGMKFRYSTLAGVSDVTGVIETSDDLKRWTPGVPGLDYDSPVMVPNGGKVDVTHTLSGTGPSPAGQSADHLTPDLQLTAGAALGGLRVENLGMVGVGRISASTTDQFGETLGGSSGLGISDWSYDSGLGRFTGTLNMLPDRGFNSGTTFSNYAARVHRLAFTFTPYYGNSPTAQGQVLPVYQSTTKFTYQDGAVTKFTTGLNPSGTGTLFGQTVGTVTTANGPGGTQQSLLSFDAEALQLLPDGSGFVSDEYGCYIARFDTARKITGITRLPAAALPHRPFGTLNFDSSTTPVNGRRENQGLEGLSITPDGTRLFALLQSGLVQDIDTDAAQSRNNTRLFVYDISSMLVDAPQLIGEYVLKLPRFDSNGNGSGINRTANQSEIVAIGPAQFLMLPEDGNGLGSGSTDPGVYKSVQLVDFASATNILGLYDTGGAAVSPDGVLRSGIKAAASKDVVNLLNPADHAKFGINTNNSAPNTNTLQEKLEGMALVPDLSTARTDDHFLFVANDNDFQASSVKMLNTSGTLQNLGDGRQNAGNGKVTNDAVFYVYRLLISSPEKRFFPDEGVGVTALGTGRMADISDIFRREK